MKRRRTFDAQGNPIVEVQTRDGFYTRETDETALRRLKATDLSLQDSGAHKRPDFVPPAHVKVGTNPYDGAGSRTEKPLRKRNSIDYLRALSEEIKKRRESGEK